MEGLNLARSENAYRAPLFRFQRIERLVGMDRRQSDPKGAQIP